MRKLLTVLLFLAPAPLLATDGEILINQSVVMSAGGFPYVISQPGSYKLTGNLTVPVNNNGIQINSSFVTVDLNGFNIASLGPQSSLGISSVGNTNITIRNGSMTGWLTGVAIGTGKLISVQNMTILGDATLSVIIPAHSAILKVVSDGHFVVLCPSLISESVTTFLFAAGNNCTAVNSSIDAHN